MSLLTDLVAHWKLNEASGTRNDSHGTNHLTDNNTVASATGKIGDAGDFERGNSEYLSIADNSDLSLSTDTPFTIAMWVKLESVNVMGLYVKGAADNNDSPNLYIQAATNIRLRVGNGSSAGVVNHTISLATGVWYFIIVRHDPVANELSIQVDNGTPTTASWSGGTVDNSNTIYIGARDGGLQTFDGLMDSVSFWKRVLTSDEGTSLWNSGDGLDYESFAGGAISGTAAVAFSQTASLSGDGALSGTTALAFDQTGTVTGAGALSASEAMAFSQSGTLNATGELAVTVNLTFAQSGTLTGDGALTATATLIFDQSGTLTGTGTLSATASLLFADSATLSASGALTAIGMLAFGHIATLTADGALVGLATLQFSQSATLSALSSVSGSSALTFGQSGSLISTSSISGSVSLTFGAVGSGTIVFIVIQRGGLAVFVPPLFRNVDYVEQAHGATPVPRGAKRASFSSTSRLSTFTKPNRTVAKY